MTADDFTADPHHDPSAAWAAGDDHARGHEERQRQMTEPIRLDVVPDDFLRCPDEDCGRGEVLMLPDGSLACAAPDCCARRGTWITP